MNKIFITGRATKDPELKYLPSNNTATTSFSLAVQRNFKNAEGNYDADFINCTAWRSTAEYIAKYLKKGKRISVVGRLQVRKYKAQDGTDLSVTEVIAEEVEILDFENKGTEGQTEASTSAPSGFVEVEANDDDVPF